MSLLEDIAPRPKLDPCYCQGGCFEQRANRIDSLVGLTEPAVRTWAGKQTTAGVLRIDLGVHIDFYKAGWRPAEILKAVRPPSLDNLQFFWFHLKWIPIRRTNRFEITSGQRNEHIVVWMSSDECGLVCRDSNGVRVHTHRYSSTRLCAHFFVQK